MSQISEYTPTKLLSKVFNQDVVRQITFNTNWHNGTGYLNGLMTADLDLKAGEVVKCVDNLQRRILIVGIARKANAVIFERYSPEHEERSSVVVANLPTIAKQIIAYRSGSLTYDDVAEITGYGGQLNVGEKFADIVWVIEEMTRFGEIVESINPMPEKRGQRRRTEKVD